MIIIELLDRGFFRKVLCYSICGGGLELELEDLEFRIRLLRVKTRNVLFIYLYLCEYFLSLSIYTYVNMSGLYLCEYVWI